ncbi:hypothetical protein D3874_02625 [Oleomonas cavernae]|uniref:Uncharacterized protein n=2 Tax=Oleomonas cavernae TaxID=2320859 RepID=A0A418WU03_9PROT|nr:hypothetical protein D3874_02625 [Oleomonas cavernae]
MDFEDGLDRLKIVGGPDSYASFLAGGGSIVASGADVVVFMDAQRQDYVRLVGVDLAEIGRGDFLFA